MKGNIKRKIALFFMGIIIGISVLPVYAYTVVYSDIGYYGPQQGYSYMNRSFLEAENYPDGVQGNAGVGTQDSSNAPTGYMGVNAWLYEGTTLVDSSGWYYNPSPDNEISSSTSISYSRRGDFYADGQTRAYNGNGYYTYAVFSTPIIQY